MIVPVFKANVVMILYKQLRFKFSVSKFNLTVAATLPGLCDTWEMMEYSGFRADFQKEILSNIQTFSCGCNLI